MRPVCAAPLLIMTTRPADAASSRGNRRSVRANGPRTLLPNCSSNPSVVVNRRGGAITPALFSSMSTGTPSASMPSANDCTEARSARSRRRTSSTASGCAARISSRAASPLATVRTASTTRAPAAASRSAASRPVPLFAPVTAASRPVWSGTVYMLPPVKTIGLLQGNRPAVCRQGTAGPYDAPVTFRRARTEEQREARRRAILGTAEAMLAEMPVAALSLNELSRRVGLAKSNVLRYFETREAVLLELLDAAWREWLDGLAAELRGSAPGAAVDERGERVATAIARTLADRPTLCELASASSGVLERNISVPAAATFKRAALANTAALGNLVREVLPELP